MRSRTLGIVAGFGSHLTAVTVSALSVLLASLCVAASATAAVGAATGTSAAAGSGATATMAAAVTAVGQTSTGSLTTSAAPSSVATTTTAPTPDARPVPGDHRITHHPHDHCRRSGTGSDTDRAEPATDVRTRDLDPNPDPGGGARRPAVHGWVGERSDRWHGGERRGGSIVTSGGDLSVGDGGRDALMCNPDDGRSGRGGDDHRCRRHRGGRRSQ